jgi:CRP-like cAMP-binding protein
MELPSIEENEELMIEQLSAQYGDIVDHVRSGGYFGDGALMNNRPRAATVITTKKTEFLIISIELFKEIRTKFEKTNREKLKFMMDFFPKIDIIDNQKTLEYLLYLLEERVYHYKNGVILQGTPGKHFYMIHKGTCELFIRYPDAEKKPPAIEIKNLE